MMRTLALGLVVAGLVAGTVMQALESTSTPVERRAGDYVILAADFHVHAYPGDGVLAPWLLRREVARQGLDAFALTNHNQTLTGRFARWLADGTPGPIVLVGQEVTATHFHISAVGINRTVDAERSAIEVIEDIHSLGGVAIANHPESAKNTAGYDAAALIALDGFERAHPILELSPEATSHFEQFEALLNLANPEVAYIGSSDFHSGGSPGWCRTYVLAGERSAEAIVEAIRAGRTVAADGDGRLYGRPEFVALVEGAGGHVPPPEDSWGRVPALAVWLGLALWLLWPASKSASHAQVATEARRHGGL